MSKIVSVDEALEIINSGKGIITGGGYTFFDGHYCAHGPIPGCFRGGCNGELNPQVKEWRSISLRELVLRSGFFPDAHALHNLVELQSTLLDFSICMRDMIEFCVDSKYTKNDFHGSARTDIWQQYFKDKEMIK